MIDRQPKRSRGFTLVELLVAVGEQVSVGQPLARVITTKGADQ